MNPDTAKIIDRLVLSRDGLRKLNIADYAMIREAREAMSDAANALTNYAKTFAVIQETDQAAAPHMLPAPEGVSEAKRDVADLIGRIIAARDDFKNRDMFGARYLADVLADAANALSSERERAERAERIRDQWHSTSVTLATEATKYVARAQAAEAKVKELEAPFDWTAEDLVDLMAEAIMDAIDMDTNATDYARAALIALNKEGLLRPNDYREPQQ